jgi:hypothetical protein
MDSFDISEVKGPPSRKITSNMVWNILTILSLVSICCVVSAVTIIFINPNSNLNPFPPPTMNPALWTPTPTVTLRFKLIPSWTPTSTVIPATETSTPVPTNTPEATNSMVEIPTATETAGNTTADIYAFELQDGSPAAISGDEFHQKADCNWSGVAGQATSLNGEAVKGLFVELGGSLPGIADIGNLVMTGLAPQYGQGGFEFTLANQLIATTGTLWIQLLDQQNLPLSERIYFDTYNDCEKNLVIIYFNQVH